jgi:2-methylisocitrate lyase-like PEP mutase family enzyme
VTSQQDKAAAFRALHEGEPFVIPNPWDAGSARVLAALGFEALASTSSGFAYTLGRLDGGVTLDDVVEHASELDRATDLPVSVDLENGYGEAPESAAEAIRRVAQAGGFPFVVTARAENHIRGNPDLDDTIARLQAFEAAGADVLYAPGLRTVADIRSVCESVAKPVNVLAVRDLSFAEIADAGAGRVSVGGALTWVAVNAFADAARAIRERGDFSVFGASPPLADWF